MEKASKIEGAKVVAAGACHHTNHARAMLMAYSDKLKAALVDGDAIEAGICADKIAGITMDMDVMFKKLDALAKDGVDELITIEGTNILDIKATVPW